MRWSGAAIGVPSPFRSRTLDDPTPRGVSTVSTSVQLSRPGRTVFPEPAFRTMFGLVRHIAIAGIAGLATGIVVGGGGGRLFMRAAGAAARDTAQGARTEAGFTVGEVTFGGTVALILSTSPSRGSRRVGAGSGGLAGGRSDEAGHAFAVQRVVFRGVRSAVAGDELDGVVRVAGDGPAAFVDETVVVATQQDQVLQIGPTAVGPMDQVVGVQPAGAFTAGKPAAPVPEP